MLSFIIMDDENKHNLNMGKRLNYLFDKNSILACSELITTNPLDVLKYSIENTEKNNVYFLDVDFGCQMNGIELAKKVRENDVKAYIVFISAHPEFVMSSLKTKIFDFLVKPISIETLENCILSIQKDFLCLSSKENNRTLLVKSGMKVYHLKMEDIIFLEKYGHLLVLHTLNGQIRSQESLEKIESKLDNDKFFRCHKSYIVNLEHVKEIDYKNNLIFFKNEQTCLFSKRSKRELKMKCPIL